jgi:hypothetical protein
MKKRYMFTLFLIVAVFAGCDKQGSTHIQKTVEIDGCTVKYIYYADGPNFYIARCGDTTTTTWQEQSGKQTITSAVINTNDAESLRNRLSEIEARDKALAKLTAEERKILGL